MQCRWHTAWNCLLPKTPHNIKVCRTHSSLHHITLRQQEKRDRTDWFKQPTRGLQGQMPLSPLVPGPGHACPVRTKDRAPRASLSTRYPHLCPLEKKTQSPSLRNYKTQNPFTFNTPNTLKSQGKGRTRGHSSTILGVTNSQQLNVSAYIQKPEDTTINKYEDTTATAKLESAMLGGSQETYEWHSSFSLD